jgi:hypothetical protein
LEIPRPSNYQLCARAIVGLAPRCGIAFISILVLTQISLAHSIEVSGPGTGNVNNCNASYFDFEADLKRLTETITEGKDIPSEFLQKYFAECTIEKAGEFLAKSGFATGDSAPAFNHKERGITRTILAKKTVQQFGMVSLNCRIVLQNYNSSTSRAYGFFYFDGP